MPSGLPPQGGEIERPSKHRFDGLSYAFENVAFEVPDFLIKSFCVNKTKLRDDRRRFPTSDFPDCDIIRIFLACGRKRDDETNGTTECFEDQYGPCPLHTSSILFESHIHAKLAPAYIALTIQQSILACVNSLFLLIPTVEVLFHTTIISPKRFWYPTIHNQPFD